MIDHPLLERIRYLLVTEHDVYGTLGHQLTSRLHMDFLRMQAEKNLLDFVPSATRERVRAEWYRDAPKRAFDYLVSSTTAPMSSLASTDRPGGRG